MTPRSSGYLGAGYHTGSKYLFVTWHELTVNSFDPVEIECDANNRRGGVSLALLVLNITVFLKVTVNNKARFSHRVKKQSVRLLWEFDPESVYISLLNFYI